MDILDVHTHNLQAGPGAIINLPMMADVPETGMYSVGIHPWDTSHIGDDAWQWLVAASRLPQVVAIGESGLDALKGAPLEEQEAIFRKIVALSEEVNKPLIVHAVRTFNQIIALHKELKPRQKWIVHGFRGKPQLAQQLLNAGIDISLGENFNPDTLAVIPPDRLYAETDMSSLPIDQIRSKIFDKSN